jgi:hypothetical protein
MKSLLKKITFWLLKIGIALILIFISLFTSLEKVDYTQEEYYKNTLNEIDAIAYQSPNYQTTTWKAGWGEASIVPKEPLDFAGYGRKGKFEFVADSTKVRTILLSGGHFQMLWIELDLLIITPTLKKAIIKQIQSQFPHIQHFYFTASHTHKSFGGWSEDVAGKFLLGGFQPEVMDILVNQSLLATQKSVNSLDSVRISYKVIESGEWVKNRLNESFYEDPYLRVLTFTKKNGKKALWAAFSAHATCLSSKYKGLSGDYPSLVSQLLSQKEYELALICAGAVGSHSSTAKDGSYEALNAYSQSLLKEFHEKPIDSISIENVPIKFAEFPLYLPQPQWRIHPNFCFRAWVFDWLLSEAPKEAHFTYFQLGEIQFLGTPCDFSGELYPDIQANPKKLIITSFNGSYAGYFSHPSHYFMDKAETRDMNWYGETGTNYLLEVVNHILMRMNERKED